MSKWRLTQCRFLFGPIVTLVLGAMAAPAVAQTGGSSGVIHGTITDESGASLPGVTATLTSPALQLRQIVVVSDAEGNYRFAQAISA